MLSSWVTHSRRDKDMSDNKAIKQTIRVFRVGEFYVSVGEIGQKGAWHLFGPLPRDKNTNVGQLTYINRNNAGK